ncbi:gastrotropin-like isoform X2 [Mastacembelus armatus]|uniref:gastrotropin-like isoform X2 n=1 Tax=Mastacembelus armatus TaxID=205130 RepID=UPI000E45C8BD|nr:gastrotropin-like isoform X2 [Mastacembelus armatus]
MAFSGKYELESQENYEKFLETIGLLNAKTDHKVVTEVVQDGNNFIWTQTIPNWTWSNKFTVGQECELTTMTGSKFETLVTMEGGKISLQFPQYQFTAELIEDKLNCVTPGEKGVTFKRVSKRI